MFTFCWRYWLQKRSGGLRIIQTVLTDHCWMINWDDDAYFSKCMKTLIYEPSRKQLTSKIFKTPQIWYPAKMTVMMRRQTEQRQTREEKIVAFSFLHNLNNNCTWAVLMYLILSCITVWKFVFLSGSLYILEGKHLYHNIKVALFTAVLLDLSWLCLLCLTLEPSLSCSELHCTLALELRTSP